MSLLQLFFVIPLVALIASHHLSSLTIKNVFTGPSGIIPLTKEIIKKNLLRFLQLEIYKMGSKHEKINRIWENIMHDNPSSKQIKNGIACTIFILS